MITLYHGSNVEVRKPQILTPNRTLDFGSGVQDGKGVGISQVCLGGGGR